MFEVSHTTNNPSLFLSHAGALYQRVKCFCFYIHLTLVFTKLRCKPTTIPNRLKLSLSSAAHAGIERFSTSISKKGEAADAASPSRPTKRWWTVFTQRGLERQSRADLAAFVSRVVARVEAQTTEIFGQIDGWLHILIQANGQTEAVQ